MSCCYLAVCKNMQCPELEHQLQRLNGQEAYDAKQASRIRFYGGAFMTEHASKCPQVITHSPQRALLGGELHKPAEVPC